MKRTAPIRILCLCLFLWPACRARCQELPSIDSLQGSRFDGSNSAQVKHQPIGTWSSLPDAPSSVQSSRQALNFHKLVNVPSPRQLRETAMGHFTPGPECCLLTERYQTSFIHPNRNPFFERYLYPSVPGPRYHFSTSDSLMGRASYAASRIFVTRDNSGRARLNTPYLLGLLSSLAVHSASHPNLARSTLATFNSVGSTAGGDAGMNVFREFGPGLLQIVKGHTPKFVSRVEGRFTGK